MIYDKITHGYVIQSFDEKGQIISQKFVADNGEVTYEQNGSEIEMDQMPLKGQEYYPFDMIPYYAHFREPDKDDTRPYSE
jgi:hypothetical protein